MMKQTLILTLLSIGLPGISSAADLSVTAQAVTATRGDKASLSCTAAGGCPPYTYKWTSWTKGNSNAVKTGQSPTAKVLETCSVTVTVTDKKNKTATATATITITPRDWNVVHSTSPDAWSDWGSFGGIP